MSHMDAMVEAAKPIARARVAVLRELAPLSLLDRATVLAQVMVDMETPAASTAPPPDRPKAPPPKRREEPEPPPSPPQARPSPRSGAGKSQARMKPGDAPSRALPGKTTGEAAAAVADVVAKQPGLAASEIAQALGSTRDRMTRTVRLAMKLGLVVQKGSKSSTRYYPPDTSPLPPKVPSLSSAQKNHLDKTNHRRGGSSATTS